MSMDWKFYRSSVLKILHDISHTNEKSLNYNIIFVEPACGELEFVVTLAVQCMCVRLCICPLVGLSGFVRLITLTCIEQFYL